ncbi:hypothetical protein HY522_08190 [bacterium]|nr:hypothetical protein [bacterium]
MAPLTLEERLLQLRWLSAPAALAAWEARHPEERVLLRATLEAPSTGSWPGGPSGWSRPAPRPRSSPRC